MNSRDGCRTEHCRKPERKQGGTLPIHRADIPPEYTSHTRFIRRLLVNLGDLVPIYIRHDPECPASGVYTPMPIGEEVNCSIAGHDSAL